MIHKFTMNGVYIAMDINGGSVHVLDEITYDMLDFYEEIRDGKRSLQEAMEKLSRYPQEELASAYDEIRTLEEDGLLYTEDAYETMDFMKNRKPVVKALCLNIAHDCNLACRYCFAEEGEYHGRRALMSFEVGKKALDFLIANSGSRRNLAVDFFGGEPLMNWQVVKDLVAY